MRMRSGYWVLSGVMALLFVGWLICLPEDLFRHVPYSTVVLDREGELLGARIADDGQWRFPPCDSVPAKYATAVVEFEDRGFWHHPGFSVKAIGRAVLQNIKAGHVESGGSTITMQVVRLSRNKGRTLWQKIVETVLATRLEARCTKQEILCMYASHAPFGGNVVGLEAAAWRYLGCPPENMSWAESALMAVLPNAPSSMHVSKNRPKLLEKRNRLLARLRAKDILSESEYQCALEEPLPEEPKPLPSLAYHEVEYYNSAFHGEKHVTDIDASLQSRLEELTTTWNRELREGGAPDLAAVVVDVKTLKTVAYCGNADLDTARPGMYVDAAASYRSTGSILKPLLYCAAIQEDLISPGTLLPDLPMNFNGFTPRNYNHEFSGAVSAREALCKSLNVPFVYLLKQYGIQQFCSVLEHSGLWRMQDSGRRYGLSLILGGGETSLDRITWLYASMASIFCYESVNLMNDFPLKDKRAIWCMLDAMADVNRPDEVDRDIVSSIRPVAWKTGTSYGSRDAWAIGVTPDYAVGVWVGNVQGGGCPGITGARTAGPVMFDIFNTLPCTDEWFQQPEDCSNLQDKSQEQVAWSGMERIFMLDSTPLRIIYPTDGATLSIPRQLDGETKGITLSAVHQDSHAELFWHMDGDYLGSTKDVHKTTVNPLPGNHTLAVMDDKGNSIDISFKVI